MLFAVLGFGKSTIVKDRLPQAALPASGFFSFLLLHRTENRIVVADIPASSMACIGRREGAVWTAIQRRQGVALVEPELVARWSAGH